MIYQGKWYTARWVPITESLPDANTDVLTTDESGFLDICFVDEDGFWLDSYEYRIARVIAWMPLPEPYKEPSDGDQ